LLLLEHLVSRFYTPPDEIEELRKRHEESLVGKKEFVSPNVKEMTGASALCNFVEFCTRCNIKRDYTVEKFGNVIGRLNLRGISDGRRHTMNGNTRIYSLDILKEELVGVPDAEPLSILMNSSCHPPTIPPSLSAKSGILVHATGGDSTDSIISPTVGDMIQIVIYRKAGV
jgi:hypothetical protein